MFSTSQVRDFKMKLLITSLIFTLVAGRIVFKTPEEEAILDAGNLYFSVTFSTQEL